MAEAKNQAPKAQGKKAQGKGPADGKSLLGITAEKGSDFSEWYTQVINRSELIEYYDVSGCYILRPWAYQIWEGIQTYLNDAIKKTGVQNAYFPLFVSNQALNREKDHIEGFSPEVAWVTRSGDSELSEPVAIRPTSETIMYPCYSKWVRSHRDLPLRLNQWSNIVRWEFKHPVPFLRTREFLWQEGHSAFATLPEAEKEVLQILDIYANVYEELLAVPVVKGRKSEGEKFAGGFYTTTVEAFIPAAGRGIQGATSHCLGQNFSKMFDIVFEDENNKKQHAWQNSWGLTTRTIGVMIMVHSDNNGLVLPPRVAPIQVVLIPLKGKADQDWSQLTKRAEEIAKELEAAGIRVHLDARDHYSAGWKYAHWEVKGVPLRLEYGPRDHEAGTIVAVARATRAKSFLKVGTAEAPAGLAGQVHDLLENIHKEMLDKARAERDSRTATAETFDQFLAELDKNNLVLVPWCEDVACEEEVKKKSGEKRATEETGFKLTGSAKTLCLPFEQPELAADAKCFHCQKPSKKYCLFGRSY